MMTEPELLTEGELLIVRNEYALDLPCPRVWVGAMLAHIAALKQALDMAEGPHCTGCGNAIDPDTCHCGEAESAHNIHTGHSAVPMGCDCYRDDTDWRKVAGTRGMLLWKANQRIKDLEERQQELLKTIVRVTNETPYPDEIKGWTEQRAKLIAEIGSLKAEIAETARIREEDQRNQDEIDRWPGSGAG